MRQRAAIGRLGSAYPGAEASSDDVVQPGMDDHDAAWRAKLRQRLAAVPRCMIFSDREDSRPDDRHVTLARKSKQVVDLVNRQQRVADATTVLQPVLEAMGSQQLKSPHPHAAPAHREPCAARTTTYQLSAWPDFTGRPRQRRTKDDMPILSRCARCYPFTRSHRPAVRAAEALAHREEAAREPERGENMKHRSPWSCDPLSGRDGRTRGPVALATLWPARGTARPCERRCSVYLALP